MNGPRNRQFLGITIHGSYLLSWKATGMTYRNMPLVFWRLYDGFILSNQCVPFEFKVERGEEMMSY